MEPTKDETKTKSVTTSEGSTTTTSSTSNSSTISAPTISSVYLPVMLKPDVTSQPFMMSKPDVSSYVNLFTKYKYLHDGFWKDKDEKKEVASGFDSKISPSTTSTKSSSRDLVEKATKIHRKKMKSVKEGKSEKPKAKQKSMKLSILSSETESKSQSRESEAELDSDTGVKSLTKSNETVSKQTTISLTLPPALSKETKTQQSSVISVPSEPVVIPKMQQPYAILSPSKESSTTPEAEQRSVVPALSKESITVPEMQQPSAILPPSKESLTVEKTQQISAISPPSKESLTVEETQQISAISPPSKESIATSKIEIPTQPSSLPKFLAKPETEFSTSLAPSPAESTKKLEINVWAPSSLPTMESVSSEPKTEGISLASEMAKSTTGTSSIPLSSSNEESKPTLKLTKLTCSATRTPTESKLNNLMEKESIATSKIEIPTQPSSLPKFLAKPETEFSTSLAPSPAESTKKLEINVWAPSSLPTMESVSSEPKTEGISLASEMAKSTTGTSSIPLSSSNEESKPTLKLTKLTCSATRTPTESKLNNLMEKGLLSLEIRQKKEMEIKKLKTEDTSAVATKDKTSAKTAVSLAKANLSPGDDQKVTATAEESESSTSDTQDSGEEKK
ncbi:hypothetical protein LOAG_17936 [Loa loa]|uniref:Uncharacterized protein n=1 Tax=Loa loa TaxID=7209 RepID=A0A1S0UGX6_LOALO|nr:hypothetical protein LOAG_17936 [Loa loa]EJD74803.1 hypothetical protein LOAG_17936 [Loa loa]